MPLRSLMRLASLTVLLFATLTACAPASKPLDLKAPPPAIVTRTETVTICPAELKADPGRPPAVPDGAVIQANDAGQGWLSALYEYANGLSRRFTDAQKACPK